MPLPRVTCVELVLTLSNLSFLELSSSSLSLDNSRSTTDLPFPDLSLKQLVSLILALSDNSSLDSTLVPASPVTRDATALTLK